MSPEDWSKLAEIAQTCATPLPDGRGYCVSAWQFAALLRQAAESKAKEDALVDLTKGKRT